MMPGGGGVAKKHFMTLRWVGLNDERPAADGRRADRNLPALLRRRD